MLLSAFAYAHFFNIADQKADDSVSQTIAKPSQILGHYEYKAEQFFGQSNALLTDFARDRIANIQSDHQGHLLSIMVPAAVNQDGDFRLRQWEKVAARSAAIADAFEKAGQDGRKIKLHMPETLISNAKRKSHIHLVFTAAADDIVNK
ncbi:MAG: hypothetical protein ABJO01_14095 [Parasphingorhabdus sp.]|uniref:hypothetical protein n=1 Tax=Parasphingorhabdus sp. TaxID=2709688 RepID=UPI0032974C02